MGKSRKLLVVNTLKSIEKNMFNAEKNKRMNVRSKIIEETGKIKSIDADTPFWQITVGEFLELQRKNKADKRYEYGLKGIAKIFGCSVSHANRIKGSGIIDEAIIQNGNIIIIEIEKALQLFGDKKEKSDKKSKA